MTPPKNAMEIFKHLDKSNCRKCGAPTCLAFAAAVFQNQKALKDCPKIPPELIETFGRDLREDNETQPDIENAVAELKAQIADIDLAEAAERTGGRYANGRLTIKILGKDLSLDSNGKMYSDLHIHHWIVGPVLSYVIHCKGAPETGNWVSFRELEHGRERDTFFVHRCEKPLKKVADTYPSLFEDMIHIFNGRQVEKHYQSDISLVLYPLPKVPFLICYWKPDEGLPSTLNLFFDKNAEQNLPIGGLFNISTGMTVMFEKLAQRHGFDELRSN